MARRNSPPAPTKARTASAGDVYAIRIKGGRFGLVQALATREEGKVELATIDALCEVVPRPSEIAKLRFLRRRFGSWGGTIDRRIVDAVVPWYATFVTKLDPLEVLDTACTAWGGWFAGGAFLQWRADQISSDEEQRSRSSVDRTTISIDLGAGPALLRRDTWRMWLGERNGLIPVPASGVRWSELEKLPLTEISYRGSDSAFIDYVRSRKMLSNVSWLSHGQREIDLSDTFVLSVTVDAGDAPARLVLPRYADSLKLRGDVTKIQVVAPDVRYPFSVALDGPELPASVVRGLEHLEVLSVWAAKRIDVRRIARYEDLLDVAVRGAPGSITNVGAFAKLRKLRALDLHELYDFDAQAFPSDLPALESVHVRGLEKSHAAALKKKLASVPDVEISGARSADWIRTNLENPFRGWEEENARMGKAACAAWRKASAAAAKAGPTASKKAAEGVLRGLVDALNTIDEKTSLDTIRREESFEAFMSLAGRFTRVPTKDAEQWFGAWRNF